MILCDMESVVIAAINAVPMLPETAREIEKAIRENVKLIDAEPVRHGRWMRRECAIDCECICSECGYKDYVPAHENETHGYWFRRKYCPHCGAKMDLTNENRSD